MERERRGGVRREWSGKIIGVELMEEKGSGRKGGVSEEMRGVDGKEKVE